MSGNKYQGTSNKDQVLDIVLRYSMDFPQTGKKAYHDLTKCLFTHLESVVNVRSQHSSVHPCVFLFAVTAQSKSKDSFSSKSCAMTSTNKTYYCRLLNSKSVSVNNVT